jgi:hypothetical protein
VVFSCNRGPKYTFRSVFLIVHKLSLS